MNPITFDLLPGMSGPDVVNLQDGLRLMLERAGSACRARSWSSS
ncbi:hypothetical protein AB0368_05605 [Actinoplanes sp. NPDC051475]